MADTNRRVPLWAVALVGGMGVLTILGLFIYGSYSGLGFSIYKNKTTITNPGKKIPTIGTRIDGK